jgi:membrane associated rhomboid family serine protease
VTWILIAANVVVFALQLSRGFTEADIFEYGAVPDYLMRGEQLYTLFTSMFMHVVPCTLLEICCISSSSGITWRIGLGTSLS